MVRFTDMLVLLEMGKEGRGWDNGEWRIQKTGWGWDLSQPQPVTVTTKLGPQKGASFVVTVLNWTFFCSFHSILFEKFQNLYYLFTFS